MDDASEIIREAANKTSHIGRTQNKNLKYKHVRDRADKSEIKTRARKDGEIQRGRAGKENSSGEAGLQQVEHTAGKGRRGSRNRERMQKEVLWWQDRDNFTICLQGAQLCEASISLVSRMHVPPRPQLWSSPMARPAQAEPWRYFSYLLWEILTQKAFSLWDYLPCFCEEVTVGTPCSSRDELFALWDAYSDG